MILYRDVYLQSSQYIETTLSHRPAVIFALYDVLDFKWYYQEHRLRYLIDNDLIVEPIWGRGLGVRTGKLYGSKDVNYDRAHSDYAR